MSELHGVMFKRDQWWVVQCLEADIGAQAITIEDAMQMLERSLAGYVAACQRHGLAPFADLPSAPQEYWDLWQGTSLTLVRAIDHFRAHADHTLPRTELRLSA
jgi:predicted RNase H-like HicB family nuclease